MGSGNKQGELDGEFEENKRVFGEFGDGGGVVAREVVCEVTLKYLQKVALSDYAPKQSEN